MAIDEAMRNARQRIEHYRSMEKLFDDMPEQQRYYKRCADTLERLCDEVVRLDRELLVAVGRP